MKLKDSVPHNSINQENKINNVDIQDISSLLLKFQRRHRNIFVDKIGDFVFIYRSLNRKEYKLVFDDPDSNAFEKEDIICKTCVLWPEDFNFDEVDAGVPTSLCKSILENSFLSAEQDKYKLLDYYRTDMFKLDNQINCLINEAFPQLDIEDIEEWDMEKTMKYLSRAEWKLHNLRGLQFVDPSAMDYDRTVATEEVNTEEINVEQQEKTKQKNMRGGNKQKLTPEKLAELKAKYPEIDWENDAVMHEGIDALNVQYDTTAPALRPGFH